MIQLKFPNPSHVFNRNIYEILWNYNHRLEVHYGGGSSGKSHGLYQKVVLKALENWSTPRKVLVIRKVQNTLKDSSFAHVKRILSDFGILQFCKVNKSDLEIRFPNGALLLFKGLDDPEKIKSIEGISDILIEEATELTLDDFTQLNMRLRDIRHKQKQIFVLFNPVAKINWVFDYFFVRNDHGGLLFKSTYKDNKFNDQGTIDFLMGLRERNPAYFKIYAEGEFATLDRLVFPKYTKRLISTEEVLPFPQYNGLDFGYVNDPSAFLSVRFDEPGKRIFITREYVKKGMLNNQVAQSIKDIGMGKEIIFADSAEQKSIDEIRYHGVERIKAVEKWPNSVIHGLQWLNQYDFIIDERCFKTIEEFENYTWKKDKKTGEYYNEPVDTYNHTIDALRYALSEKIKSQQAMKVMSRASLGL